MEDDILSKTKKHKTKTVFYIDFQKYTRRRFNVMFTKITR
jgi:hypothetical protein